MGMEVIRIMGTGYLGVFLVTLVIIAVVTLLKKHSQTIKYIGGGMLIIVGLSMVFNLFGYYLAIFN